MGFFAANRKWTKKDWNDAVLLGSFLQHKAIFERESEEARIRKIGHFKEEFELAWKQRIKQITDTFQKCSKPETLNLVMGNYGNFPKGSFMVF